MFLYGLAFFGILDDSPPSESYHSLNAIVKQYCRYNLTDSLCPRNASQVREIAPEETRSALGGAQITYQYYPKTRDYTLIIRNNNYRENNNRADSLILDY